MLSFWVRRFKERAWMMWQSNSTSESQDDDGMLMSAQVAAQLTWMMIPLPKSLLLLISTFLSSFSYALHPMGKSATFCSPQGFRVNFRLALDLPPSWDNAQARI